MKHHVHLLVPVVACLAFTSPPGQAEVFKCRQGDRVIYQEMPCPAGSKAEATLAEQPRPSAYDAAQARERAKGEIKEAAALRKRDEKAAEAQQRRLATTRKLDIDCTRLLDKITKAEDKATLNKNQKNALKIEQRKYRKECGPL